MSAGLLCGALLLATARPAETQEWALANGVGYATVGAFGMGTLALMAFTAGGGMDGGGGGGAGGEEAFGYIAAGVTAIAFGAGVVRGVRAERALERGDTLSVLDRRSLKLGVLTLGIGIGAGVGAGIGRMVTEEGPEGRDVREIVAGLGGAAGFVYAVSRLDELRPRRVEVAPTVGAGGVGVEVRVAF